MKLPTLLIVSILFVGTLGFWFDSASHSEQGVCPVSLLSAGGCSFVDESSSSSLALHHVAGFQSFTQSGVTVSNAFLLVLLLLALATSASIKNLIEALVLPVSSYKIYTQGKEYNFIRRKEFIRWLSLRYRRYPNIHNKVYVIA